MSDEYLNNTINSYKELDEFLSNLVELCDIPEFRSFTSPWMTVKQTCAYLNLGDTKVRQLIREGKIPHSRIGGSIRIHKIILDKSILLGRNIEMKSPNKKEEERFKRLVE